MTRSRPVPVLIGEDGELSSRPFAGSGVLLPPAEALRNTSGARAKSSRFFARTLARTA